MNWIDIRLRLRAILFPARVEDDLDEELRLHLAMQIRRNLESGMSQAEARRHAAVQFGGLQLVKEQCRDKRGIGFIDTLSQDVRYALRGFRRTPGFALTVVVTIGLGLGLNTTLFSFFNAYVLQPLTVRDPDRLYRFTWANRSGAGHRFTWQEAQDIAKENPAFSEVIAIDRLSFARVDGHLMLGHLVTGNYFRMLGVGASLGRTLVPEDAAPVAVLSYSAWTRKFAADPNVVGRKMLIHGYPVEVIGVARADFRGLGEVPLDYWVPIALAPLLEEGPSLFGPNQPERIDVIGSLRPGVSLKQAQAALTSWARQRTAARPDKEQADHAILRSQATILPLDPMIVAAFSPVIVGFGLVLVIACSNVANMMLARAMVRQREMGIRLAMGAAQSRLIRQLLTESILLALPASAAGLWVSQQSIHWGERLLLATLPGDYLEFIMLAPLQPDARVFVFMLAAAAVSALLFGLAPAIQATRPNVMQAARGEFTTDFRASRLRDVLVIGQVAVSVLLLIFAATLLRANHRLSGLDVGLRTAGVIELNIQDRYRAKVIRELASQPGVQSLAAASKVPFEGSLPRIPVSPEQGELYPAGYLYTSPEYFSIFQVPIQRGRAFTREESAAGSAVAIISQSTAQRLWGTRDPLGQTLHLAPNPRQAPSLADPRSGRPPHASVRIIGIARDAVNGWVGDGIDHTCIYFPTAVERPGNVVFARVFGDSEAARRRLDAALTASVPGTVDQFHSMDQILAAQLYPFRALYWISSAVGGLALLLTLSGIYGVLSYAVTQRTKEIGIRMALGARPGAVARLVLAQSLRFACIGAAIGSFIGIGAIRLAASQVDLSTFGAFDPAAFLTVLALVTAATTAAAWIPSRRAAGIEPLTTLRRD